MQNNHQGFSQSTIFLIGFTFVVGLWFLWVNYLRPAAPEPVPSVPPATVRSPETKPAVPADPSGAGLVATTTVPNVPQPVSDPGIDVSGWQTYKNDAYGFEFKYPKDFFQKGISMIDVLNCDPAEFSKKTPCPQSKPYNNEKISLANNVFWRCQYDDSAAGSVYKNYKYIGVAGGKCFSFEFVVRHTNCGVYGNSDGQPYKNCEKENLQKEEVIKKIEANFEFIDFGDPARVAKFFYDWYMFGGDKSSADFELISKKNFTPKFIKQMEAPTNFDKLICAQDTGFEFSFAPAVVNGDRAAVAMKQNWKMMNKIITITIELIKANGRWMIDDVVCPQSKSVG